MTSWLRAIAAFIAGILTWVVAVTLINFALRAAIPGYALAEHTLAFSLGMMLARLAMAAVTSVAAGSVARWVKPSSQRVAWVLGISVLASFVPVHYQLWQVFPVWYHLTFLSSIVPLIIFGSWLARPRRTSGVGLTRATS